MCLCILVSMCPCINVPVYQCICLIVHQCVHISVYPCVRVPVYPCICPLVHQCAHVSVYPCICSLVVVVVYPLPWPLLVGGVRCSRLWSTSQLLRPSGQQCSHSGGVCPQIQGRQCGAYVGAVEEMMCVVCVDVTEGA